MPNAQVVVSYSWIEVVPLQTARCADSANTDNLDVRRCLFWPVFMTSFPCDSETSHTLLSSRFYPPLSTSYMYNVDMHFVGKATYPLYSYIHTHFHTHTPIPKQKFTHQLVGIIWYLASQLKASPQKHFWLQILLDWKVYLEGKGDTQATLN